MEPISYFLGFNICFLAALGLSGRFSSRKAGKHTARRLLLAFSFALLLLMLVPQRAVATLIIERSLPTDPIRSPYGIDVSMNSSFVVFAEKHAGKIGFLGTGQSWFNGSFNERLLEFPLPGFDGSSAEPRDVALGNLTLKAGDLGLPEGFVWFTEFVRNRIGRLSFVGSGGIPVGQVDEFSVPTPNSGPWNLAIDPYNGSIWFTEYQANKIGRLFNIAGTTWRFIEYSLPTPNSFPVDLAVDPNYWHTSLTPWGTIDLQTHVWFTMSGPSKIGRLNAETGEIVEYSTRETPWGITVTPQSLVWFTQKLGDRLAKLNPWTALITEVSLPIHSPGNEPLYLTNDTDGSLWFTESATNRVGKYVPGTNVFQEFVVPTTASKPHGIAVTPRLWGSGVQTSPINHYGTYSVFFTEEVGNKIGKIIVPSGPWTTTTTVGFISSASTTTSSATTVTTTASSTTTSTALDQINIIVPIKTTYGNFTTTLTDTVSVLATSTTSTWTKTTTTTSITTTTSTGTSVTTTTSTTMTTTTLTSTSTLTFPSTTTTTTTASTTYTSTSYSPTITTPITVGTVSTYMTTTTTTTTSTMTSTSQVPVGTTLLTTVTVTTTPAARACVIASVAYGSELAPEVKFLREFRDQAVMSTFAGSQFMKIFNIFYYSFSPSVSKAIEGSPLLQASVRTLIYPLIASLRLAAATWQLCPQASQLMIVVSGVLATGMVGLAYVLPTIILLTAIRKNVKASGGV